MFKIAKCLPVGSSRLLSADNSGANILQVIGYIGFQGTRKRSVTGGVVSIAVVLRKKLPKKHYALIVKQKYA